MRQLLLLHMLLLLLASTDFTIVTAGLGGEPLRWCYYKYASQDGFGYTYVSDFNLPVVLTYFAAFAVGAMGFLLALKHGHPFVGSVGLVISVVGTISFAIEASHWAIDHNRSWLAFSPAAMFVLAACALLPRRTAPAQPDMTAPQGTAEGLDR